MKLAYMTGILLIAKYSDDSELNMFVEYNMAMRIRFGEYICFSEEEVTKLFEEYRQKTKRPLVTRDGLKEWYDDYHTAGGERLYNLCSVVCALSDNQLANYWTSSGIYDFVFGYVRDNVADVQDDLTLMFAGESIAADIQEYAATTVFTSCITNSEGKQLKF